MYSTLQTKRHKVLLWLARGCTRQRRGWESNPRPLDQESDVPPPGYRATLTIGCHYFRIVYCTMYIPDDLRLQRDSLLAEVENLRESRDVVASALNVSHDIRVQSLSEQHQKELATGWLSDGAAWFFVFTTDYLCLLSVGVSVTRGFSY